MSAPRSLSFGIALNCRIDEAYPPRRRRDLRSHPGRRRRTWHLNSPPETLRQIQQRIAFTLQQSAESRHRWLRCQEDFLFLAGVFIPLAIAAIPLLEWLIQLKLDSRFRAVFLASFLNFFGLHGDGTASQVDLPKLCTEIAIPMFFIEGEQCAAPADHARRDPALLRQPEGADAFSAPNWLWCCSNTPATTLTRTSSMPGTRMLKERILPLAK